ncbi:MAG TPA: T9SS type A sorting domain-containing protein, partial [Bacteroidia bacterium]|nr:T9SS type A sorting domain-containing protein [Bacteroidia bacterium]
AFGLWVALAAGGNLVELPLLTGVEDLSVNVISKTYPNPATEVIHVQFTLRQSSAVNLKIRDLSGREMMTESLGTQSVGGHEADVNVSTLPAGTYLLELSGDQQRMVKKINVVR